MTDTSTLSDEAKSALTCFLFPSSGIRYRDPSRCPVKTRAAFDELAAVGLIERVPLKTGLKYVALADTRSVALEFLEGHVSGRLPFISLYNEKGAPA